MGWGARGRGGHTASHPMGHSAPRMRAAEGPRASAASLPSQRVTCAPGFQTGHCHKPASVTAQSPRDPTRQPDGPGGFGGRGRRAPGEPCHEGLGAGLPGNLRATGGGLRELDGRGRLTACPAPAPRPLQCERSVGLPLPLPLPSSLPFLSPLSSAPQHTLPNLSAWRSVTDPHWASPPGRLQALRRSAGLS